MLCFDVDFMGFPKFHKNGNSFQREIRIFHANFFFWRIKPFFFLVLEAHFNATWTTHLQTHLLTFACKIHEVPIKPKMVYIYFSENSPFHDFYFKIAPFALNRHYRYNLEGTIGITTRHWT